MFGLDTYIYGVCAYVSVRFTCARRKNCTPFMYLFLLSQECTVKHFKLLISESSFMFFARLFAPLLLFSCNEHIFLSCDMSVLVGLVCPSSLSCEFTVDILNANFWLLHIFISVARAIDIYLFSLSFLFFRLSSKKYLRKQTQIQLATYKLKMLENKDIVRPKWKIKVAINGPIGDLTRHLMMGLRHK